MTQQIRTPLGSRWVGTPQDDAERYNVSAADAWNSAQHQNSWQDKRFQQGRGDAWAMNRDNLNFGAWNGQRQDDRADTRSAAAVEAQRRIAEMGYAHDATMFDKRTGVDDARDVRNWDREKPFREQTLSSIALQNKLAQENADLNRSERQRLLVKRQARETWLNGTPDVAESGGGDDGQTPWQAGRPGVQGFKQIAGDPNASIDDILRYAATDPEGDMGSVAPLMQIAQQNAQTQADRILQQINSNDQTLRARGLESAKAAPAAVKRLLGALPENLSELSPIDPSLLPSDRATELKTGVTRSTEAANKQNYGFESSAEQTAAHVEGLRARVLSAAKASGVSPDVVWGRMKPKLDTGRATWNAGQLFGLFDDGTQDANEEAIRVLDQEFGAF